MDRNRLYVIGGIAVLVLAAGAAQFISVRPTVSLPATVASSTESGNTASTTVPAEPETIVKEPVVLPSTHPLPLGAGETVASWSFKGPYADRPDLIAKTEAEIVRLTGLLGTGEYTDVILYVSIANQYGLLGDGEQEYDYLGRAIQADVGSTTGLPWHNLGVLMERLGAFKMARVAYEKATLVQPELKTWHYAYLEFLTSRMKGDTANIEKAFAAASANIGQDAYLLQVRADWQNS